MSTAPHYRPNLRDIAFNLFEFLDVGSTSLGKKPFGELDETTVRAMLETAAQVCVEQLAASFSDAGEPLLTFDRETATVRMSEGLKRGYHAYHDAGLNAVDLGVHLGGMGAPPTVNWALFELVAGANPALAFTFFGSTLARIVDTMATADQKKRFIAPALERRWGGSMVLTEPDAGSDVGAARTRARHVKDDVYHLEGVKHFITNGEFDAVENIIHLVLARPEGAGPGTKGLSMFIVPKFLVNDDGSLGERNGVRCTGLEHKMGLKGSATCELTFGDGAPCVGYLCGNVHDGIRQMFQVIEYARMAVGVKSAATVSTAYLNALAYAKDRVQGPDLMKARDKAAPKVAIINHPDVRRMLLTQKAFAEGMRALTLFTASVQDQVAMAGGHGDGHAEQLDALNDLLLPLVKGYCSEKAWDVLSLSLQTFGGSGYIADYPVEQYVRDQKIDTLYEGTTHIQAMDLILRKMARDGGQTLMGLLARVRATVDSTEGGVALAAERRALGSALDAVEGAFGALLEKLSESLYHVGFQGNRMLFALAELIIGWLLVRHAAVAVEKRATATGPDADFYDGKVASARFYCQQVLPALSLVPQYVKDSSLFPMELPVEAF